jgi:hypothetical protein
LTSIHLLKAVPFWPHQQASAEPFYLVKTILSHSLLISSLFPARLS